MHTCDNVCQTRKLIYIGHAKALLHLWKFTTWRFICRGLCIVESRKMCRNCVFHYFLSCGKYLYVKCPPFSIFLVLKFSQTSSSECLLFLSTNLTDKYCFLFSLSAIPLTVTSSWITWVWTSKAKSVFV